MTILERSELILTFVITILLLLFGSLISPNSASISQLILYGAALLLLQGLMRDLCILFRQRRLSTVKQSKNNKKSTAQIPSNPVKEPCFCLESAVGLTGVIAGLCLLSIGFNDTISLNSYFFAAYINFILVLGFFLKNYVFGWSPWKIYKEPDHMNVIFQWKS